jgi:hypothetical protein
MPSTVRVYLDASIALNYRPVDEINWRQLVGADQVCLVVTSIFLREIDSQKDSARGRVQKRARRVSSWLASVRRDRIRTLSDGTAVEIVIVEPETTIDFQALGLSPSSGDDRLIACMLRDASSSAVQIACATADNALAFKVEAQGFRVVELSDEYKLAEEPDETEQENRELKRRLLELQQRLAPAPALRLESRQGASFCQTTVKVLQGLTEEEIESAGAGEFLTFESETVEGELVISPASDNTEKYKRDLAAWLNWHSNEAIASGLEFTLELDLVNSGPGNGSGIELSLEFPEGVAVGTTRKPMPAPPKPNLLQDLGLWGPSARIALGVDRFSLRDIQLRIPRPLAPVRLKKSKSERLQLIHVEEIAHRKRTPLPKLHARFTDAGSVKTGFKIKYTIHTTNPPEVSEGVIGVSVRVEDGKVQVPDDPGVELDSSR